VTARPEVLLVAGRTLSAGRRARDLPETKPYAPLRSLTTSDVTPRLSWGNAVRRRVAGGGVGGPRWVHTGRGHGFEAGTARASQIVLVDRTPGKRSSVFVRGR
jgi:hypothetical protein